LIVPEKDFFLKKMEKLYPALPNPLFKWVVCDDDSGSGGFDGSLRLEGGCFTELA
jgi:hypothetical protein